MAWKSEGQEAASGEHLCDSQDSAKPHRGTGSHMERDGANG